MQPMMGVQLSRALGVTGRRQAPAPPRRARLRAWFGALVLRCAPWADGARRQADREIARRVLDPDAAIGEAASARLRDVSSARHRAALARAVRRNVELGQRHAHGAPPVARVLARNRLDAVRVAEGLERSDADPRAVIATEQLLSDGRPAEDRLAWIARVLAAGAD
jgi:hypothetical protein